MYPITGSLIQHGELQDGGEGDTVQDGREGDTVRDGREGEVQDGREGGVVQDVEESEETVSDVQCYDEGGLSVQVEEEVIIDLTPQQVHYVVNQIRMPGEIQGWQRLRE